MNIDEFDQIVGLIYEGSQSSEIWKTVAEQVGASLKGGVVHIFLGNSDDRNEYFGESPRINPEMHRDYFDTYAALDVRLPRIIAAPQAVLFDERQIISKHERRQSPVHNELFPRHQIHKVWGANLSVGNTLGWFGISPLHDGDEFCGQEIRALERLLPHLHRSFRAFKDNTDLKITADLTNTALDCNPHSLLIYTDGQLSFINNAATIIIERGFLYLDHETLRCRDPQSDGKLQAAFIGRHHIVDTSFVAWDRDDAYQIRIYDPSPTPRLGMALKVGNRIVSIRVRTKTEKYDVDRLSVLCERFSLTKAELLVLKGVLDNVPLRDLSQVRKVNVDTVRKQLKSAMAKLDVSSQKQLVQMFEQLR